MKSVNKLNKNINKKTNPIGSNFIEYLAEEGILEECLALSSKELIVYQLKEIMEEEAITKQELANRMHTSRAAINRLLDENNQSVTLALPIITGGSYNVRNNIYSHP